MVKECQFNNDWTSFQPALNNDRLAPKRKGDVLYGMLCHKINPEPRVITLVGDPSGGITGNRRIEPAKCLPKDAARANVRCCATTGSGAAVSKPMSDYGCSGSTCAACKGPTINGQAWPNEHPGHTYDTAKQYCEDQNLRLCTAQEILDGHTDKNGCRPIPISSASVSTTVKYFTNSRHS